MTMKRSTLAISALVALCGMVGAGAGDYYIVVNKDNANANTLDKDFVSKIYRGEAKTWKDGSAVAPYDLPEDNPARAAFLNDVVHKTPAQAKALWATLMFSGKALPPKAAAMDAEVISAVATNKNAIGYVSAPPASAFVKVIK